MFDKLEKWMSWKLSRGLSFLLFGVSDGHIFFNFSNYCPILKRGDCAHATHHLKVGCWFIRELDLRFTNGCSGPRLEARVGSPYQSTSGSQQWVPPTNFIWLKLGLMEVVLCCCFCVFLFERQTINLFSQRSFWDDAGVSACAISDNDNYPARALGLLLADGAPIVGGGKTFCAVSRIFLRKQL